MRPVQKVLMTLLWGCAVVAMLSAIGAGMLWRDRERSRAGAAGISMNDPAEEHLPVMAEAPPFELTDQNGKQVTLETLKGRPWIADFVFTNCAGPCPVMTAKLAGMQKTVPDAVRFVSVSVDPKADTPPVLKAYAEKFKADESRWHFLTSPDADAVYGFARGMLITALPATEKEPIIHSEKFILVDAAGKIRGYYSSGEQQDLERLVADAKELAGQ